MKNYKLTEQLIVCVHCHNKAFMNILCEGKWTYDTGPYWIEGRGEVNEPLADVTWQVLICTVCEQPIVRKSVLDHNMDEHLLGVDQKGQEIWEWGSENPQVTVVYPSGEQGLGIESKVTVSKLREHLSYIKNTNTARFLEEAITSFEHQLYRSAVVLSWSGAISLLYDYVLHHRLADFNIEATRRDSKWRVAKTEDDLARMKESDFLDVLDALSIIGKSVKQQLQYCLTLRNGCGHPNTMLIEQHIVASHIEILILNVFCKFT